VVSNKKIKIIGFDHLDSSVGNTLVIRLREIAHLPLLKNKVDHLSTFSTP
jgi:hypothetical protein